MAAAQAETKYILLTDGKIEEASEMKSLCQACVVTHFDYKTHNHWRLDELMLRCQMLVIDISDVDSKRYFLQQKGQIQQAWRIIYRLKTGSSTTTGKIAELKVAFAASVVIKHLPEFGRSAVDFFARLLSGDHIPKGGVLTKLSQCCKV